MKLNELKDRLIGVDRLSKKGNVYTARRGYFYGRCESGESFCPQHPAAVARSEDHRLRQLLRRVQRRRSREPAKSLLGQVFACPVNERCSITKHEDTEDGEQEEN